MAESKKKQQLENTLRYKPTEVVRKAVWDSELVINYIAEAGIKVDEKDIEIITKAKEALSTDNWTKEIEQQFWVAFRKLATEIKPVTVDSLRAVNEPLIENLTWWHRLRRKKYRTSIAFRSVRFYTIFAIVIMIIMLVIHIYFSIGSIRLNKIQISDQKISKVEQEINDLEMMSAGNEGNLSFAFKKDKLVNQLYELNQEKESNIKLLYKWLRSAKWIFFWREMEEEQLNKQSSAEESGAPVAPEEVLAFHISTINEAGNYLMVLGFYILPLLYGLLGAMAFVLRELRDQIRSMTFTKEMNINFTLRLILGTILGLAVGVFWSEIKQQESLKFIQTINQLLAAFLAGLTVEVIFRFIEKLIRLLLDKVVPMKSNGEK